MVQLVKAAVVVLVNQIATATVMVHVEVGAVEVVPINALHVVLLVQMVVVALALVGAILAVQEIVKVVLEKVGATIAVMGVVQVPAMPTVIVSVTVVIMVVMESAMRGALVAWDAEMAVKELATEAVMMAVPVVAMMAVMVVVMGAVQYVPVNVLLTAQVVAVVVAVVIVAQIALVHAF